MTLDEALLYDAEWWLDTRDMPCIFDTFDIFEEYGYSSYQGNLDACSFFALLIREAIRHE